MIDDHTTNACSKSAESAAHAVALPLHFALRMPDITTAFPSIDFALLADVSGGCCKRKRPCCPPPAPPQPQSSFSFSAQAQMTTTAAAPAPAPQPSSPSVDVSVGYA